MTERREKKKEKKNRRSRLNRNPRKPSKKGVKRRRLKLSNAAALEGKGYNVFTFWGSVFRQIDMLNNGAKMRIPKSILKKKK